MIPVPGSAPLVPGGLWVPRLVANQFRAFGLAREVLPIISRMTAVPKSAFARPSERPNVRQHYESLIVASLTPAPASIVLLDDVVTQGCTFLAVASRVSDAYPDAEIRAFALVRTMSGAEVDHVDGLRPGTLVSPCTGVIEFRADNGRATRSP